MKHAQVSIEFMSMVVIATLIIVIFMGMFSKLYQDNLSDKKRLIAEDYSFSLQNEILLASEAKTGYQRTIIIPETLEGYLYDIQIQNNTLLLNYTDDMIRLEIPDVQGTLKKGTNTITTQNTTIIII